MPEILSLATAKDGTVYVGTFREGVFRTTDQGKTWQSVNAGLKRKEVKTLLAVGDQMYAGTADGAYRLNRADGRWTVVTSGLDEGQGTPQDLVKEPLDFEYVHLTQRSYK